MVHQIALLGLSSQTFITMRLKCCFNNSKNSLETDTQRKFHLLHLQCYPLCDAWLCNQTYKGSLYLHFSDQLCVCSLSPLVPHNSIHLVLCLNPFLLLSQNLGYISLSGQNKMLNIAREQSVRECVRRRVGISVYLSFVSNVLCKTILCFLDRNRGISVC